LGEIAAITAWVGLCGAVLWIAAVAASFILAFRMGSHEQAGSEFILLILAPFYLLTPLVSAGGAIAGFWLAARTNSTAGGIGLNLVASVLAVSTIASLLCAVAGWAALSMVSTSWWSGRRLGRETAPTRDRS
jgi:hypothetical protein